MNDNDIIKIIENEASEDDEHELFYKSLSGNNDITLLKTIAVELHEIRINSGKILKLMEKKI